MEIEVTPFNIWIITISILGLYVIAPYIYEPIVKQINSWKYDKWRRTRYDSVENSRKREKLRNKEKKSVS